jgi:hypothetical protein
MRWPVHIAGSCYGTWGSSRCEISELSESGLTVVVSQPLRPGDELTVAWRLENSGSPMHVTCVVRQVSGEEVGLEFVDATLSQRLNIFHHLKRRLIRANA